MDGTLLLSEQFQLRAFGGYVVAYAMIPVRTDFFIETDYLPKEFVYSKQQTNGC
jgi:hypothetical protein